MWNYLLKFFQTDELHKLKLTGGLLVFGATVWFVWSSWRANNLEALDIDKKQGLLEVDITRFDTNMQLWQEAAKEQAQLKQHILWRKNSATPMTDADKQELRESLKKQKEKKPDAAIIDADAVIKLNEQIAEDLKWTPPVPELQDGLNQVNKVLENFVKTQNSFVDLGYKIDATKKDIKNHQARLAYLENDTWRNTIAGGVVLLLALYFIHQGNKEWKQVSALKNADPNKKKLILPDSI